MRVPSTLLNAAFNYVINTSKKYNIDESHALKHSLDVFHTANQIYKSQLQKFPYLADDKNVIDIASILHDMCDKKYVNEASAINEMEDYMLPFLRADELAGVSKIISTMSYSKVKQTGFPVMNDHFLAYHIVREADLLCSYDPDRCIMYGIMRENMNYLDATNRAIPILENRVLKYIDDKLFLTDYSKKRAPILHKECQEKMNNLRTIIYNDYL